MALSERERGIDLTGFNGFSLSLRTRSSEYRGPATLTLPDGRRVTVEADLTISRSMIWASGQGFLHFPSDFEFDALDGEDWLTLTIEGKMMLSITIYALRTYSDGSCQCRFEVMS